jgi:hypothetical protein
MVEADEDDRGRRPQRRAAADERRLREAAALRANLGKRKTQARARAASDTAAPRPDGDGGEPNA